MMAQSARADGVRFDSLVPGGGETPIRGLSIDSRGVQPGWLFLACRGHDHHGLKHLADARARGAAAVAYDPAGAETYLPLPAGLPTAPVQDLGQQAGFIAARFYADPTAAEHVTAVTGTNGKTSVSLISAQALSEAGRPCGALPRPGPETCEPGSLQPRPPPGAPERRAGGGGGVHQPDS
jgi:UDP-N-acetylmuramyl tripeptide synthase